MEDRIEKNQKVTIAYVLKDTNGQLIEEVTAQQPISYLQGHQNIVPGLEKVLEGKRRGEKLHATIPFEEAYGPFLQDLIMEVPAEELQDVGPLTVGMEIELVEDQLDDEDEFEENDGLPEEPSDPEDLYEEEDEFEEELEEEEPPLFVVKEIRGDIVVLDGNHPLAGKDLVFDVEILEVESATFEEIEQGFINDEEDEA